MASYSDKELADLLRALPPAPPHVVEAAAQIPRIKEQVERVLPHLGDLAGDRQAETAALEAAIEAAGLEPEPQLLEALRRQLGDPGQ